MNKGTFTINGDSPSTSPTDRRLYAYNALGQIEKFTDPNGTVHQGARQRGHSQLPTGPKTGTGADSVDAAAGGLVGSPERE